jgi:small-conductance mechanosensitive channel
VIETLEGIAGENDKVVDVPAPRVRMRSFGDNSINLELLCWILRPQERGAVVHRLILQIIRRFREQQIEIPFPQRDLHVKEFPQAHEDDQPPDHGG